eukprot:6189582-Pleurochrysis_carterae.AAC.1
MHAITFTTSRSLNSRRRETQLRNNGQPEAKFRCTVLRHTSAARAYRALAASCRRTERGRSPATRAHSAVRRTPRADGSRGRQHTLWEQLDEPQATWYGQPTAGAESRGPESARPASWLQRGTTARPATRP